MPDKFECVPYPSPATSWDSPPPTQAVDLAHPGADQPTWSANPIFDPSYQDTTEHTVLTAEQMAAFYELESMFNPYDLPPDPNMPTPDDLGQLNLFPTSEEVVPQFSFGSTSVNYPPIPTLQLSTPHGSPNRLAHSQPRQDLSSLSPLALNTSAHPPSPPYTYDRYQRFQPYPIQRRQLLPSQPAANQIQRRPRVAERMSLPGAGDLNVSMCDIIM